jgi:hypothetical protein
MSIENEAKESNHKNRIMKTLETRNPNIKRTIFLVPLRVSFPSSSLLSFGVSHVNILEAFLVRKPG